MFQTRANFPQQLYILLEEAPPEIISWLEGGRAFRIHNKELFCANVLPAYFEHSKMASFHRQMNIYGFRMDRRESNQGMHGTFSHPRFLRGHPELLVTIERVPNKADREGMMMAAARAKDPVATSAVKLEANDASSASLHVPPPHAIAAKAEESSDEDDLRSQLVRVREAPVRRPALSQHRLLPTRTCFVHATRHLSTKYTSCTCREAEHSLLDGSIRRIRRRAAFRRIRRRPAFRRIRRRVYIRRRAACIRGSIRCTRWSMRNPSRRRRHSIWCSRPTLQGFVAIRAV